MKQFVRMLQDYMPASQCFAPQAPNKNWDLPCATRHVTLFLSYVLYRFRVRHLGSKLEKSVDLSKLKYSLFTML